MMTTAEAIDLSTMGPSEFLVDAEADLLQMGHHFEVSKIGLRVIGRPAFEVCEQMSKILVIQEKSMQFVIGDFFIWAEGIYGEDASQLIDVGGWTQEAHRTYTWVSGKVPPQVRRTELTYSHHRVIARLNTIEEQTMWLDRAVAGVDNRPWTVAELKKAMTDAARDVVFTASVWKVIIKCESQAAMDAVCRQLDTLSIKHETKAPRGA